MNKILITLIIIIFALLIIRADRYDTALRYIGACVDIAADKDGMRGTPKEKWDLYVMYCQQK